MYSMALFYFGGTSLPITFVFSRDKNAITLSNRNLNMVRRERKQI